MPLFNAGFWGFCALAAVAALGYGTHFIGRAPDLSGAAVRALFAAALAGALYAIGAHPLLFIALGSASIGDFVIALQRRAWASLGIAALAVAALGFLTVLGFRWIFAGDLSPLWPRYLVMALGWIAIMGAIVWLAPRLRWAALIVVPYILLLGGVMSASFWQEWPAWPIMLGGGLYAASQVAMIGGLYSEAEAALKNRTMTLAWWGYACAQGLLIAGLQIPD